MQTLCLQGAGLAAFQKLPNARNNENKHVTIGLNFLRQSAPYQDYTLCVFRFMSWEVKLKLDGSTRMPESRPVENVD